jgi:hypothetical protein
VLFSNTALFKHSVVNAMSSLSNYRHIILSLIISSVYVSGTAVAQHQSIRAHEVDQLKLFPQESDLIVFPGLELPNSLKIEGATIGGRYGVTITKVDGPGEIRKIDSNYYWMWKPDRSTVGQTYTIKLAAKANRGSGVKDQARTQFSVSVKLLQYADRTPYYSLPQLTVDSLPRVGMLFKVNEKMANLDGSYKTELSINGQRVKESSEPVIDYMPERMKDGGKTLRLVTYFKSSFMKDYIQIDDKSWVIGR